MGKIVAAVLALVIPLPLLAGPPVILLKDRDGHAGAARHGTTYTGGGNVDVQQPAPDTVVVTLTGAAVATDHPHGSAAAMTFELGQGFEVVCDRPGASAKLTLEARVVGLLRGGRQGTASESGGAASVIGGGVGLVTAATPARGVAGCENLSVNDKSGPASVPVGPGPHLLHAVWTVSAVHPRALLGKAAAAEFAPDPALDPLWVGGPRDVFHGAAKKDFGFQITLKIAEEANGDPGRK